MAAETSRALHRIIHHYLHLAYNGPMSEGHNFALVGYCKVCGQGRQFIARELSSASLYVVCEDCEAEWNCPSDASMVGRALTTQHGQSEFVEVWEIAGHPWATEIMNA